MRGIGNLIGALIVVMITIAVGVAIAMITGSLTQTMEPRGGSVVITQASIREQSWTQPNVLLLTLTIQNTGAEAVRITRIDIVRWDGSTYVVTPFRPYPVLPPNNVLTVTGRVDIGINPPDYRDMTIIVYYVTQSGFPGTVMASAEVVPWYD